MTGKVKVTGNRIDRLANGVMWHRELRTKEERDRVIKSCKKEIDYYKKLIELVSNINTP